MHVRVNAITTAGVVLGADANADEGSLAGRSGETIQVRDGQAASGANRAREDEPRSQERGGEPDEKDCGRGEHRRIWFCRGDKVQERKTRYNALGILGGCRRGILYLSTTQS